MSNSLHMQLLDATKTAIEGLGLTGISSSNVVVLQVPDDKGKWLPGLPGIMVAPFGRETLPADQGTNRSDDIGYPVLIAIVDVANQAQTTNLDGRLYWREQIIDEFFHNRLSIAGEDPIEQTIEPLEIVNSAAWFQRQLYVSALVVRCTIRKLRRP